VYRALVAEWATGVVEPSSGSHPPGTNPQQTADDQQQPGIGSPSRHR